MMRLEPPTPGPSNCGLPEGILHQHVGICWRAGYAAGCAEYSSISEERDRLRREIAALADGIAAGTTDFMAGFDRAGSGLSTRMSGETAAMVVQIRSEMEHYVRALLDTRGGTS